ncbi:uncharacterized protein [Henckelia pumila]|uniref:uncharacterized protein n=1 Tax=Henckelia pumila TaxID=405737 RepID=UPI003C6E4A6D
MMESMNFDIEKFTGRNDFSLWRIKMQVILIQQGLVKALKKKEEMSDDIKNKDELLEKAHSAIILCLGDRPLREVAREEYAAAVWLKLKNLYMTKSLANLLYMKQRRDFPERKGKQQEKHKEDGTLAIASDGYDSSEVLVVCKGDVNHKWILNSGIKGSGNIEIRMHDGIDRVLTNERYVPELKRNLISLGTLDAQGYSFKLGAGSLSVSKGSLVIMEAVKKNLLYVLQDNFVKICKEKDITRHRTVAGTPQQNGLAERMNKTLLKRVRCMLINASLPKSFWGEALSAACYLVNRCPSSEIDFKTPMEKWSGTPEDYSNLRSRGPKCFNTRDVKFDETKLGYKMNTDGKDNKINENFKLPFEVKSSVPDMVSEMQDENVTSSEPKEDLSTYNLARDRTRREIRAPKRCVYMKKDEGQVILYLLIYVDDILIASKSMAKILSLKQQLSSEFDIKDLGEAKRILGMDIMRNRKRRDLSESEELFE